MILLDGLIGLFTHDEEKHERKEGINFASHDREIICLSINYFE